MSLKKDQYLTIIKIACESVEVAKQNQQEAIGVSEKVYNGHVKALQKCNTALRGVIDFYFMEKQYDKIVTMTGNIALLMKSSGMCIAPYVFSSILKALVILKMQDLDGTVHKARVGGEDWYDRYSNFMDSARTYYKNRLLIGEACCVIRESNACIGALRTTRMMETVVGEQKRLNDMLINSITKDLPMFHVENRYNYASLLDTLCSCCTGNKIIPAPKVLKEAALILLVDGHTYNVYNLLWCCVLSDLYQAMENGSTTIPSLIHFPSKANDIQKVLKGDLDADCDIVLKYNKQSSYEIFLFESIVSLRKRLQEEKKTSD